MNHTNLYLAYLALALATHAAFTAHDRAPLFWIAAAGFIIADEIRNRP